MAEGLTVYSKTIPGCRNNWNWPARFDRSNGFIGITQDRGDGDAERVLLSPRQIKALRAFTEPRKRKETPVS